MLSTSIGIVNKLKLAGFEAYWAGGCVRDYLMGREPTDYDIVTSAKPNDIEILFDKTYPIGKKFGVILVNEKGHNFEIATFRSDASYSDGRRPDAVYFASAKEDAWRRDFTINGMFYDPIGAKVLDYVGGEKDLLDKKLRFIGEADERIKEDNLRILRAIRFKNNLGFDYAPGTLEAISANAELIKNVSSERIADELTKILVGANRGQAFREMDATGILELLLPEVSKLHGVRQPEQYHIEGDVFEHTMMAIEALPDNPSVQLVWATLLHDIGKPATYREAPDRIRFDSHAGVGAEIARQISVRLKLSTSLTNEIIWLVAHHIMPADILKMKKARQAHWIHNPLFPDLLELLRADSIGTVPTELSIYNELKELLSKKELLLPMPEVLITGEEIMREFDVAQGPMVGKLLEAVREAQMEEEISTRQEARELISRILAS
ncbi:CCA tRNA nucleotidyltransferase [Candidatus Saccharibacteria bacterium]|nr:CCA tRNA nucleotidyltransferase [Candidatus Saccharibacteria bacterium]